ncbi:MAG: hypothetical protein B6I17_04565 [Tenericutes bacterium 4572_104]|nr:MAG: hypothetical protein B6I17_04565 [Tenericutes bacterium 4572_104]
MSKKANIEIILESFSDDSIVLDYRQTEYKKRLLIITEVKLKNLYITDYDLYKKIKKTYASISFPQICNDVSVVERMIATSKDPGGNPNKTFIRYFITETTKKAIALAEAKGDGYTMSYAANILGKHHLTDKEDIVKPDWDEIIPFAAEITSDPTILGIKPVKDLDGLRAKLEAKYGYNKSDESEKLKDETKK